MIKSSRKASSRNIPKALLNAKFDSFAIDIVKKLNKNSFEGWFVGGCIRDALTNIVAKDIDIVTNATPEQIRKIFKSSRIIGRRFKLVHIFKGNKIIEVATFRASSSETNSSKSVIKDGFGKILRDNIWGNINQDCLRRDFTINAIYFDPLRKKIFDIHNGIEDTNRKRIVSIGNPLKRFEEDPVRSLRAIRFSSKLNFKIAKDIKTAIYEKGYLLQGVSNARRFDEFNKLFMHGKSNANYQKLDSFDLLKYLVASADTKNPYSETLQRLALKNTDTRIRSSKSVTPGFLIAALLWPKLIAQSKSISSINTRKFFRNMDTLLREQQSLTAIPRRFHPYIKDIWSLQLKLETRISKQPYRTLSSPRFRAAYDLLLLRTKAVNRDKELSDWWTKFQTVNRKIKMSMLKELETSNAKNKKFGLLGELS